MRVKFWTVSSQQITGKSIHPFLELSLSFFHSSLWPKDVNDASRRKIATARKYDRPSPENFWFKVGSFTQLIVIISKDLFFFLIPILLLVRNQLLRI